MKQPLNQVATVWTATPNGFGGYTYSAPIPVMCRWEERSELLPGSSEMAKAVVYLDTEVSPEDYIILGASTSSTPHTAGASRIRVFKKVPDLRNLETLKKVWL